MKKYLLIISLICTFAYADNKSEEESFFDQISKDIQEMTDEILDANMSDSLKLENLSEYVNSLEFNDDFSKDKDMFNLMGHKKNFIMLFGHDQYEHAAVDAAGVSYARDRNEAQFQISIKTPLYKNFLKSGGTLYGAYTQNSYWQVFDNEHSSPFRETNYMPEIFMDWDMEKKLGSIYLTKVRATITHQSNGSDLPKSRSWNRNDLLMVFKKDKIYFGATIWNRWDEDPKPSATSTKGDDNPDLEAYIGKQKYFIKYKEDKYSLELSHQNDILDYDTSRGNVVIDCSFPSFNKNFDFIVRYFYGYGESLIDYNDKVNKLSFGILLTDWI